MDKLIIISLAVVYYFAQPLEVRADEWIRHEFRPSLSDEMIRGLIEPLGGGEPLLVREGRDVGADGVATAPPGRLHRASAAPRHRPDRETDFIDDLAYFEAYQPSVAPHKRLEALDGVELSHDGVPELVLISKMRERVEVGGPAGEGDRFIGEVWVDLSRGGSVPIPSVSPEMRILHVSSAPSIPLLIERDGAGNYYLAATTKIDEAVRVLLFVEVAPGYFNRPIPDTPLSSLALKAARLPPALETEALQFARELGLTRESSLKEALEVLVEYFRSFIEGDAGLARGGSIYSDLARGGYGICRHRAYAFMITALALGIPTRYVQNEAHAFVEIEIPSPTFAQPDALESMRIELGGSTAFVEEHGLFPEQIYLPRHPDPFPQPETYLDGMRRGSSSGNHIAGDPLERAPSSSFRATRIHATLTGYRGARIEIALRIVNGEGEPAEDLALILRAGEATLGRAISDAQGEVRFLLRIPFGIEVGTHKLELLARSGADSPEERIPIVVE